MHLLFSNPRFHCSRGQRPFGFNKSGCPSGLFVWCHENNLSLECRMLNASRSTCMFYNMKLLRGFMGRKLTIDSVWEVVGLRCFALLALRNSGNLQQHLPYLSSLHCSTALTLPVPHWKAGFVCTFSTVHRKWTLVSHVYLQALGLHTKLQMHLY
jgi:hypothetical protein